MSKRRISVIVIIAIAAGLAFAAPSHRLLYRLGFASACDGDCS